MVTEQVSPVNYRVSPGRWHPQQIYHINLLKAYVEREAQVMMRLKADREEHPPKKVPFGTPLTAQQTRDLKVCPPELTSLPPLPGQTSLLCHCIATEPGKKVQWSSPILVMPKPDGSIRFCNDFRALNAISRFNAYPVLRVNELIKQFRKIPSYATIATLHDKEEGPVSVVWT